MTCLFLSRYTFSKRTTFLSAKRNDGFEAVWIYCFAIYGTRLYSSKTVRADFKTSCRLSEFAWGLDEQRQMPIIVRRDVLRGFDCMGSSADGGCGRPATIRIMPPISLSNMLCYNLIIPRKQYPGCPFRVNPDSFFRNLLRQPLRSILRW